MSTYFLLLPHVAMHKITRSKLQSNLAKGESADRWAMTSGTTHSSRRCVNVDVFYHCIRQVAALVVKLVLGMHLDPLFWGRGNRRGQRWYYSKESMVVSYRLFIWAVTIAQFLTIRPKLDSEYLRRSNQHGVGHFGAKFGAEGVTDVNRILIKQSDRERLSCAKEIVSISSAFWAQCTNITDRQTDRQRIATVTSIPIGEIAFKRCRLKIK